MRVRPSTSAAASPGARCAVRWQRLDRRSGLVGVAGAGEELDKEEGEAGAEDGGAEAGEGGMYGRVSRCRSGDSEDDAADCERDEDNDYLASVV